MITIFIKKNRGESTEQNFVNFKYDGYLKKALLAYFLGLNLTNKEFQNLGEYYYRENYLTENRKIFNDYKDQFSLFNDEDATEIFYQYSKVRKQLGDIMVAIEHINLQIKTSHNLGLDNKCTDEIQFLKSQLKILNKTKNKLMQEASLLGKKIKKIQLIGTKNNVGVNENIKDVVKIYEKFSGELNKYRENNNENIDKVEGLLSKCGLFVKEYLGKLGYHNVDVNLLEQSFKSSAPRSEGEMATIRILGMILVNVFSSINNGRLINLCIFDTTFESIDEKNGHKLFETIEKLYGYEELIEHIPQIFCFITGTEDRFKINDLNRYNVNMNNFIDFDD